MSILFDKQKCVILSHVDYIKEVYDNVIGGSFELNPDLFAIGEPFKTYEASAKKKTKTSHANSELNDCSSAFSVPASVYQEFQSQIQEFYEAMTPEPAEPVPPEAPEAPEDKNEKSPEQESSSRKRPLEASDAPDAEDSPDCKDPPNSKALDTVRRLQQESTTSMLGNCSGSNGLSHSVIRRFSGTNIIFPPYSGFICTDVLKLKKFEQKYDVIVMDPPWTNKAIRRKNKKELASGGSNGYDFMSNEDIAKLPVDEWLQQQNGVVFMWCTNSREHRNAVERCFSAWNLEKLGMWYWLKVTTKGEPIIPFSDEESTMKQPYEVIFIGGRADIAATWRLKLSEGIKLDSKVIITVPSAMHSHKPPLTGVINQLLGIIHPEEEECENLRCLEVFARYLLPGWTSIGNEVLKLQNMCFYQQTV